MTMCTHIHQVTWCRPEIFKKDLLEQAKQPEITWQIPSLVYNSVMMHGDCPEPVSHKMQRLLITLAGSSEGQLLLDA